LRAQRRIEVSLKGVLICGIIDVVATGILAVPFTIYVMVNGRAS